MAEPKITPAMQEWCRAIADLADCRLVRTTDPNVPAWKHYRTEGINRKTKPTWAMVDRIVAAGLIDWVQRGSNRGTGYAEHVALLTELGRAQAAIEQPAAVAALTCWPFPVSLHTETP